ncbi:ABC1 kinase family protein [Geomonas propionica]|uniref:AarF/ABC1/UbiB kinase family protein n=1 Tax=Geomonas propionica TaxID=2798582 RepID=A0ABS0YW34_9BACT|nr:AarF/ABC1/UbiB kinase family protein [Geomonas propionica]MBJ6802143.1 AarF/ABC1/UbiB kinase family protein [Geomonas propionica]
MATEARRKTGIEDRAALLNLMPRQEEAARRRLAELVESVAAKRPPTTSFSRLWILGSLQAKVTCAYLAYWLRSRWADADERERLKSETHLKAALQLLGTMGYLRGAVMKLGQMLATFPDALPDEFARLLPALHFEAPAMHYAMVREVFLDEFGKEPHELFASFEREAFAAASLGQVHRARLLSGEQVAVKIQYPGIARTIEADLRNLRLLMQPMRLGEDWGNTVVKLAEVERVLLAETDYLAEASFAQTVRDSFTPEEGIVIPRVYPEYSTRRVLTTEHLEGVHLEELLDSAPSQELRDRYTHLMTVATTRMLYRTHWLLADPNPGNYIFMPDGRLGLVDFGCTRELSDEEWQLQVEVEDALLRRDETEMERLIVKASLYDSAEQMGQERLELIGRVIRWQLEPWLSEGIFDFGDEDFFRRGMEAMVEVMRKGFTRGMPVHIWTNRFILGARGVVYRLKGRCDFQEIYRRESGRDGCGMSGAATSK